MFLVCLVNLNLNVLINKVLIKKKKSVRQKSPKTRLYAPFRKIEKGISWLRLRISFSLWLAL